MASVLISEKDLPKAASLKDAALVHPKSGTSETAIRQERAEGHVERFELDGLRILLRRNPNSEVVTAKAFLDGGLPFAGKDKAGLESLMLEVAATASREFPKDKMARELPVLGAELAAKGFADYSTFTLRCVQQNFKQAMPMFLDALIHPAFNEEDVKLAIGKAQSRACQTT